MTGMEKMLASLLGISPEEMQKTISSAVQLLSNLDTRLGNIERMVAELHALDYPLEPSKAIIEQPAREQVG